MDTGKQSRRRGVVSELRLEVKRRLGPFTIQGLHRIVARERRRDTAIGRCVILAGCRKWNLWIFDNRDRRIFAAVHIGEKLYTTLNMRALADFPSVLRAAKLAAEQRYAEAVAESLSDEEYGV